METLRTEASERELHLQEESMMMKLKTTWGQNRKKMKTMVMSALILMATAAVSITNHLKHQWGEANFLRGFAPNQVSLQVAASIVGRTSVFAAVRSCSHGSVHRLSIIAK